MNFNGTRAAIILGVVPVVVGLAYLAVQVANGTDGTKDMAGVTMLIALGMAMAFGFLVILRGAKDL